MTQTTPKPPDFPQKPTSGPAESPQRRPAGNFFDRLIASWASFGRFSGDAIGLLLLAGAGVLLLGLAGLTHGSLIGVPLDLLTTGLGWGAALIPLFLAWLGILALRRRKVGEPLFRLGRLLQVEIWGFLLLANLSEWGGASLERAAAGMDGGVVGWGLTNLVERLIPYPASLVILTFLLFFLTLSIFGVLRWMGRTIETWLFAPESPDELTAEEVKFLQGKDAPAHAEDKPLPQVPARARDARLPPLNILSTDTSETPDEELIQETAQQIVTSLGEFGIPATVRGYRVGPTVTQFAVEPGYVEREGPDGEIQRQKVRVSQISALSRDLALALAAERLRIEAPVPGRSYVGIEVPNPRISVVKLRALLESDEFRRITSGLTVAIGRDVSGQPLVADLARMPHLLIAGTTGSGKSVCIEALTACLAMNNTPQQLRLAMLDPKMVELVRFNGLPHLMGKVETEITRMLGVLRWALAEMDHRYRLLEDARARDLDSFNRKMEKRKQPSLPRIVVLIDELADLMMTAPEQTEECIVRLAQMARATGIHLVVATQRPSTDVVTGLIKANFPARLAFTVATSIDSRVILDTSGAETLLGRGDLLFLNPENGTPVRAQGVMVTDPEIDRMIRFWQKLAPKPEQEEAPPWEQLLSEDEEDEDSLVAQAIEVVRSSQRASASMLQRRLRIGYPRAARLIDELEEKGIIGPAQSGGKEREVLIDRAEGDEVQDEE